ncbi:MAG: hypothetical protein ACJ74W_08480 [Pyrinomonadaceae bacterium]
MGVVTYEGIVEGGQIRLTSEVHLPEQTKVYIIVPDFKVERTAHLHSPHLKRPEQAADFAMEIIESSPDASL